MVYYKTKLKFADGREYRDVYIDGKMQKLDFNAYLAFIMRGLGRFSVEDDPDLLREFRREW